MTLGADSQVLDVGCAVGTFLQRLHNQYGAHVAGVDFKDLTSAPSLRDVEFHCGLFYDVPLEDRAFRPRHDVALPRARLRSAAQPGDGASGVETGRPAGHRGAAARQPHLPAGSAIAGRDCRRRSTRCSSTATACCAPSASRASRWSTTCPYGAFPAYFYLFTGAAFRAAEGTRAESRPGDRSVLRRTAARAAGAALRAAAEPRHADRGLPEGVVSRARIRAVDARDRRAASLMSIAAALMLPLGAVTLFRARRLYAAIATMLCRSILALYGVRIHVNNDRAIPTDADGLHLESHVDARSLRPGRAGPAELPLLSERVPPQARAARRSSAG